MVHRLTNADPEFAADFDAFIARDRDDGADVGGAVTAIVRAVRAEGFAALQRYTTEFDRFDLTGENLRVSAGEIDVAEAECDKEDRAALDFAAAQALAKRVLSLSSSAEITELLREQVPAPATFAY